MFSLSTIIDPIVIFILTGMLRPYLDFTSTGSTEPLMKIFVLRLKFVQIFFQKFLTTKKLLHIVLIYTIEQAKLRW